MMINTNSAMRRLFPGEILHPDNISADVPDDLLTDIRSGFQEIDGIVASNALRANHIDVSRDNETEVECALSKAQMADSRFIGYKSLSLRDITRVGFSYAFKLKRSLVQSGLVGPFRVIISSDEEGTIRTCTVRFHRIRTGQSWLADDLETYEQPTATLEF